MSGAVGERDGGAPARGFVRGFGLALGAVALGGALVRLRCAQGPMWLDEIWSIQNLAPLTHPWQVFWRISHDNNHFLNSLWLYWATSFSANPLVLRAPSIVMGAATIGVMTWLGRRHSRAGALAAAALTAFSYFFVDYSAEARGYAGEALALAIGFAALERGLAEPRSRARLILAGALGIGMFWHLETLAALPPFALIALIERRRRGDVWAKAADETLRLITPAAIAILPALACIGAGIVVTGRLTIGGVRAFALVPALQAMATTARDTLGLPPAVPTALVLAACAAALAASLWAGLVRPERRVAYGVLLAVTPLAVLALRPSNAHIPRYYLLCALFLILLAAEIFGAGWRRGGWPRVVALVGLGALLIGDGALLARYQASKAKAWPQALEAIEASGQRVVASSFDDRVGRLIAYFNRSHTPPIVLTPRAQWEQNPPQWLIAEAGSVKSKSPILDIQAGESGRMRFVLVDEYKTWGLSAIDWLLYRRADAPAPP